MRPTLFIGVPRVFDRIYAGVLAKVKAGGAIRKYLFDYAYKHKLYYLNQGFPHDKVPECFSSVLSAGIASYACMQCIRHATQAALPELRYLKMMT